MAARITRRATLAAATAAGVPLFTACADGGTDPTTTASEPPSSAPPRTPASSASGPTKSPKPQLPADAFTSTAHIPVGGGKIFADETVVVTQPTEGVFKAFSAVCTHQGCLVDNVDGDRINCICHGSQFSIEDGSNVAGPSGSAAGSVAPLSEVALAVDGGHIGLA